MFKWTVSPYTICAVIFFHVLSMFFGHRVMVDSSKIKYEYFNEKLNKLRFSRCESFWNINIIPLQNGYLQYEYFADYFEEIEVKKNFSNYSYCNVIN